jgi:hypothetical protein
MKKRLSNYLPPSCRIRALNTELNFLQTLPSPGTGEGGGGEMEEGGEI